MRGNNVRVATDPEQHFTGALAQGEMALLDLRLPAAISAGAHCRAIIRALQVVSMEPRSWEVVLFNSRSFQTSPISNSAFLNNYQFAALSGRRYGQSPYFYIAPDLALPYHDHDINDQSLPLDERGYHLHLMLVNRSADPKSAGPDGAVQVVCYMEPTYG